MAVNSIVLLDACVLYPAPLRDLLISLAENGLFQAKLTNIIHEEWIRNLLNNRPDLKRDSLERARDLMIVAIRDCLVTDFEVHMNDFRLPDSNDHHILAAAIKSKAEIILTTNVKDFPNSVLKQYNIEAQHPDDFISGLIEISPGFVCSIIQKLRVRLKKPPKNANEYLESLERQSLPQTVSLLRDFVGII